MSDPSEAQVKLWDAWDRMNDSTRGGLTPDRSAWVEGLRTLELLDEDRRDLETQGLITWGLNHGFLEGSDLEAEIAQALRD